MSTRFWSRYSCYVVFKMILKMLNASTKQNCLDMLSGSTKRNGLDMLNGSTKQNLCYCLFQNTNDAPYITGELDKWHFANYVVIVTLFIGIVNKHKEINYRKNKNCISDGFFFFFAKQLHWEFNWYVIFVSYDVNGSWSYDQDNRTRLCLLVQWN